MIKPSGGINVTRMFCVLLALLSITANARMFPRGKEPKLRIHPLSATGLSETQFNQILDRFEKAMAPVYAAQGKSLHIERLWKDETINSDAHWEGNVCWINAYGGLARAMTMAGANIDDAILGYGGVNAHENGHCEGGPPTFPGDVMSDEGQADTYATDGMRKAGYTDAEITRASRTVTNVLAALSGEQPTSWPGPVLPVVKTTFHDHSPAQCRLDSMMFRLLGVQRPNCWYAGGLSTGVIPGGTKPVPQPVPTPVPQPVPAPVPQPTPAPQPKPCPPQPCNCPRPRPQPVPMPFPYPGGGWPPYPYPYPFPAWGSQPQEAQ
jgi:hypothetical protein